MLERPLSFQPTVVPSAKASVSATAVPPGVSPHWVRLAHSLSVVRNSRRRPIRASISLHAAWNLCSPAAFWLRKRSSNVWRQPTPGKWALRSGARGIESLRLPRTCPTPARRCPRAGWSSSLPRTSSRQHSRQCEAPKRDRRHRRGGELRAQSCECSEKQTTYHFTSQQRSQQAQTTHAQSRNNCIWPSQRTKWRTTCSPTTVALAS